MKNILSKLTSQPYNIFIATVTEMLVFLPEKSCFALAAKIYFLYLWNRRHVIENTE